MKIVLAVCSAVLVAVSAQDYSLELSPAPASVAGEAQGDSGPSTEALDEAAGRGAQFLREGQKKAGWWGIGEEAPFSWNSAYERVAITGLAIMALEAAGSSKDQRALKRAYEYIDDVGLKDERAVRDDPEIIRKYGAPVFGWNNQRPYALAVGLELALRRSRGDLADSYIERIRKDKYGAKYSRVESSKDKRDENLKSSFQNAWVAIMLYEAKAAGRPVPEDLLSQRLAVVKDSWNKKDNSFGYYDQPSGDPLDGAARGPVCMLALRGAGVVGEGEVLGAAREYMKHRQALAKQLSKKILTHDPNNHNWAKYYYLFGAYWTAKALAQAGSGSSRQEAVALAKELASALLRQQQADGSWVDSPEAGGPLYGTAMGLLTLHTLGPLIRL